jgi:hypothetical protein
MSGAPVDGRSVVPQWTDVLPKKSFDFGAFDALDSGVGAVPSNFRAPDLSVSRNKTEVAGRHRRQAAQGPRGMAPSGGHYTATAPAAQPTRLGTRMVAAPLTRRALLQKEGGLGRSWKQGETYCSNELRDSKRGGDPSAPKGFPCGFTLKGDQSGRGAAAAQVQLGEAQLQVPPVPVDYLEERSVFSTSMINERCSVTSSHSQVRAEKSGKFRSLMLGPADKVEKPIWLQKPVPREERIVTASMKSATSLDQLIGETEHVDACRVWVFDGGNCAFSTRQHKHSVPNRLVSNCEVPQMHAQRQQWKAHGGRAAPQIDEGSTILSERLATFLVESKLEVDPYGELIIPDREMAAEDESFEYQQTLRDIMHRDMSSTVEMSEMTPEATMPGPPQNFPSNRPVTPASRPTTPSLHPSQSAPGLQPSPPVPAQIMDVAGSTVGKLTSNDFNSLPHT